MTDLTVQCPVCKKTSAWKDNPFRPFCSERCRIEDLGAWASGQYRIEGTDRPQDDKEEENSGEG